MGKLHTLRRAIERDPERFLDAHTRLDGSSFSYVRSARKLEGGWFPGSVLSHSYRKFVGKVLIELGFEFIYF
jgi:hypothetical protein